MTNVWPLLLIETEILPAISGLDHWVVTENGGSSRIREECCGTWEIGLDSSVNINAGVPGSINGPGTNLL
jgi:hypothetical protein